MLDTLRKAASGWTAKILMALLVLSFGVWGIGDVFRGFTDRDLVQIGSFKISTEDFRDIYQSRLDRLGRQLRQRFTPAQARAMGFDRQILGEIVSEATLDQKAVQLGLGVAQDEIIRRIHADPNFQGIGRRFDPVQFQEVLRQNGFTEQRYVDSERRLVMRQQLGRALGGELEVPDTLLDIVRRYQSEERAVEFVALGRSEAGDVPKPTEEEIKAFYEANKASFRAPEFRKLILLSLSPESIAANFKISDDELRKAYEQRRDRFATAERREVQQIVFANAEEAKAAAAKIAGGTSFDDLMAERGLKPADVALGVVSKRDILDPAVAEAAFAVKPGTVSDPIAGRFGTVLVRVTKVEPGAQRSFEEVSDELRKQLAVERGRAELLDRHDLIEDERAGGATLAEVAKKLNVSLRTVEAVDRSGRAPDEKPVNDLPQPVVAAAFDTPVGSEADPVQVGGGNLFVWFEVQQIVPSRERPLDEVRERVATGSRDQEIGKRLAERAEAIRKRLAAGDKWDAAAPGLRVEKRSNIRRGGSAEGLDGAVIGSIFATADGNVGIGRTEDGVGRVVFRVTGVELPPPPEGAAQLENSLRAGVQDDLLVQYVLRLQEQIGVRVNETALRSVTGTEAGL